MPVKLQQASFTKCTITPPSLNRQHSYSTRQDCSGPFSATTVLASVASRNSSPARRKQSTSSSASSSSAGSPPASPLPLGSAATAPPPTQRRTSWEDCRTQANGYISFPDFDLLQAEEGDEKAS